MLGPWWGRGDDADAVSLFAGMKAQNPNTTFTPGCTLSHNDLDDPANECADRRRSPPPWPRRRPPTRSSSRVGETREMGGEAEARSNLDLPGRQQELIDAVKATGKPFAVVLFNSRPLTLSQGRRGLARDPRGLVRRRRGRQRASPTCCSARSTRAASCRSPSRATSARCRSTTTTSRPAARATRRQKYNSRHRDIASCAPLYEFGYGLSYTTFKVDNLKLSSPAR